VQQATNAVKKSKDDQLALWFQPVCDLRDGGIVFQEALLRFIGGPGQKPLRAELFLGEINQPRHFLSLDRFVSRKICRSLSDQPDLTASINIHAASICDWKFAEELLREVDKSGIDPQRLILEITETTPLMDLLLTEAIVSKLAENGIRCAVDDLGSGFSSIHLLRNINFPFVKIDGQLVRQSGRIGKDRYFLESLQILSTGLGFAMVAEQLETEAQLRGVREFGVGLGQGYLLGHPRAQPYHQTEIPDLFEKSSPTSQPSSNLNS
jgi:EAL domain-containing protein (putative c-di-GMP-specific phosphodiesterase class I)